MKSYNLLITIRKTFESLFSALFLNSTDDICFTFLNDKNDYLMKKIKLFTLFTAAKDLFPKPKIITIGIVKPMEKRNRL